MTVLCILARNSDIVQLLDSFYFLVMETFTSHRLNENEIDRDKMS